MVQEMLAFGLAGMANGQLFQVGIFLLLLGLIVCFMKLTAFEKRVQSIEKGQGDYVTYEEYLDSFQAMWEDASSGQLGAGEYKSD